MEQSIVDYHYRAFQETNKYLKNKQIPQYHIINVNLGMTPYQDSVRVEDKATGSIYSLLITDMLKRVSNGEICFSNPSILEDWRGFEKHKVYVG